MFVSKLVSQVASQVPASRVPRALLTNSSVVGAAQDVVSTVSKKADLRDFHKAKKFLDTAQKRLRDLFLELRAKAISAKNLPREIKLGGLTFVKKKNAMEYINPQEMIEIFVNKTKDKTLFTLRMPHVQITQDSANHFHASASTGEFSTITRFILGKEGLTRNQFILKNNTLMERSERGAKDYTYNFARRVCKMFGDKTSYQVDCLDPHSICFSQRTVSPEGYDKLVRSLKRVGWAQEPIQVVRTYNGQLISLDNRRVKATQDLGIPVHAVIHSMDEALPPEYAKRFSKQASGNPPKTWGKVLLDRLRNNDLVENGRIIYQKEQPVFENL